MTSKLVPPSLIVLFAAFAAVTCKTTGETPAETPPDARSDTSRIGDETREVVLHVPAGETLELDGETIRARPGQIALRVAGRLKARSLHVDGGEIAILVEGGAAVFEDLTITGAGRGAHVRGGSLRIDGAEIRDVSTSAILAVGGEIEGRSILVEDVDHGVLGRPEATLSLSDLTIRGARFAAVALVGSRARLERLLIEGTSRHGAIIANDLKDRLEIHDTRLVSVGTVGLSLLRATAVVRGLEIEGVEAAGGGEEGAGVLAVSSNVHLFSPSIKDAAGEGLAALRSTVRVEGGEIQRSGHSGVAAWSGATVELVGVHVTAGRDVGLSATEGSTIEARDVTLLDNELGPQAADRSTGASIVFSSDRDREDQTTTSESETDD